MYTFLELEQITWACIWFYNLVSKTVEELILDWKEENPVTTGNLGMSQFELEHIRTDRCQESFQIGKINKRIKQLEYAKN